VAVQLVVSVDSDKVKRHNRRVWEFQNPHLVSEHGDSTERMCLKIILFFFFSEVSQLEHVHGLAYALTSCKCLLLYPPTRRYTSSLAFYALRTSKTAIAKD